MVLDVDSQTPIAGLEWNALRHRPAGKGTVTLKPKVIVEPARAVSLHDEEALQVAERRRTAPKYVPDGAFCGTRRDDSPFSPSQELPDRVAIVTS